MVLEKYTELHPDYGAVMTVAEFREAVEGGWLIDYDGSGNPSNGTHLDPAMTVHPSTADRIPSDATHIVWFNR